MTLPVNELDQTAIRSGRAITAISRVSPNGSGANGSSWASAYQTIQDALDAASTDPSDCTLILPAPTATFYDINRTGDPTWTGNYEILATHRIWAPIMNTHPTATSVMRFTGKVSLKNLAIFTADSLNGVILTGSGWRILKCGFNSSAITGQAFSVHLDGSAALIRGGIMDDVEFLGAVGFTRALYMDTCSINKYRRVSIHDCLVAVQIVGAGSDLNKFTDLDIGDCALGLDLDVGDEQYFENPSFHHNVRNVDDEVHNHLWVGPRGQFAITTLPDNLIGITINTGGVGAYGGDTELLSAVSRDNPFRVLGYSFVPSALPAEQYTVRFSSDNGATFFDAIEFIDDRKGGSMAPTGSEYIFNAGTRISGSARCVSGGESVQVWLVVQEL